MVKREERSTTKVFEEHQWPWWIIDDLSDLPGFQRDLWERNLALIRNAEELGNHYVGWFFKNGVVWLRRSPNLEWGLNWLWALAGLPILADVLDCPACSELAFLIEEYRPWEGGLLEIKDRGRRLNKYQREARAPAAAIRQRILESWGGAVMHDYDKQKSSPVTDALAALAERVPMFDRHPRRSLYRNMTLGEIIMGVITRPKGG